MKPLEAAVLRRLDSMLDEMVDFLRDLIAIPTVNPPGENYPACAQRIGRQFRDFGYDVAYIAADGRPEHTTRYPRLNVLGVLSPALSRPLLHFNGHLDVVPPAGAWTVSPFGGVMRDGKVYGRGAADQKAGIAASLFAVEATRRAGVRLHGSVEQSATVDEESGGFAGMAYLAQHGFVHRERTDFVVITEPLDVDRVCLGHRGVYWFEVVTEGRIAHGSMPFLGISAIGKMANFLNVIECELQGRFASRLTAMPVEPPEARYPTINVNSISGGQLLGGIQTPCVADSCTAVFDRRFVLEEPIDMVRAEIRSLLEDLARSDPEFRYTLNDLMIVEPALTDARSTLVSTVSSAVRDVLGKEPPLIASPGTYDHKHVSRLGLVEQCIAYGPGILTLAHQPDEYCRIDHLLDAAKVMALTTMRLLGAN